MPVLDTMTRNTYKMKPKKLNVTWTIFAWKSISRAKHFLGCAFCGCVFSASRYCLHPLDICSASDFFCSDAHGAFPCALHALVHAYDECVSCSLSLPLSLSFSFVASIQARVTCCEYCGCSKCVNNSLDKGENIRIFLHSPRLPLPFDERKGIFHNSITRERLLLFLFLRSRVCI